MIVIPPKGSSGTTVPAGAGYVVKGVDPATPSDPTRAYFDIATGKVWDPDLAQWV